jgi:hypothetical protein
MVRSQSRQIDEETLYPKKTPSHKKRAGGVAQGEGPEFKHQCTENKTKQKSPNNNFLFFAVQYVLREVLHCGMSKSSYLLWI